MTIQFYKTPENIQSGITIRNFDLAEQFNQALHTGHEVSAVLNNRSKLAASISLPLNKFVFAEQTHSANFRKITTNDAGLGALTMQDAICATDAMYTFEPNIVMTSFTADCVPVTFYSTEANLVGAIHSGWGGTVKEITLKLFTHLQEKEQIDLAKVQVQIGMALSSEKFEVDRDVYEKFAVLGYAEPWISFNELTAKYHIDNQLVVQKQCELAGIPISNISIDRTCTFLHPLGFSYREQRDCGRHVSFIVRKESN